MARTTIFVAAPPETVVEALREPARLGKALAVEAVEAPAGVELARALPGLRTGLELRLQPRFGQTLVVLRDRPLDGPLRRLPRPLLDALLRGRDRRLLRRLRDLTASN